MQKAAHAYLQTQVTTTSQGDLVVMLYDGAIKFLTRAKELLLANDMAGKGNYISKALDIVNELDCTLNLEKGGELAANLHNLYFFCNSRLLMANLKKSPEMIDDVMKVLSGLRSAYAEIASLPEAKAAAQEAGANMHASAILPPRAQAGQSPTGGATPLPGAGARARNMYANNTFDQQDSAEAPLSQPAEQQTSAPAPAMGNPSAAFASSLFQNPGNLARPFTAPKPFGSGAAAHAPKAATGTAASVTAMPKKPATVPGMPAATPSVVASTAIPSTLAAPEDTAPAEQTPPISGGFPSGGGFNKNMAGANLYKKFASQ